MCYTTVTNWLNWPNYLKKVNDMQDLTKISVVLPSLDPDEKLTAVIDGLLEVGFQDIILVNDGSKPENLHYFTDAAAAHPEVTLLHHAVNRGKGAALKTAFNYFLVHRPDQFGVVTVDGDNQHHKMDTRACALNLLRTGHLTLGVRNFDQPDVPERSKFGNKTTSMVFKLFVGLTISDTQTGLRAISRKDLKTMLGIEGDRFEYETNMLLMLKQKNIPFDEVEIRTVYIEENKSSHFRVITDSWRIYKLILAHFFKYGLSSVASAVVDVAMYSFLCGLLLRPDTANQSLMLMLCAIGARAVSSVLNFMMNRALVFKSEAGFWTTFGKYYALAVPQMLLQALLTNGLTALFGGYNNGGLRTLLYMVVMVCLFTLSFTIQQRWVFAKKEEK